MLGTKLLWLCHGMQAGWQMIVQMDWMEIRLASAPGLPIAQEFRRQLYCLMMRGPWINKETRSSINFCVIVYQLCAHPIYGVTSGHRQGESLLSWRLDTVQFGEFCDRNSNITFFHINKLKWSI